MRQESSKQVELNSCIGYIYRKNKIHRSEQCVFTILPFPRLKPLKIFIRDIINSTKPISLNFYGKLMYARNTHVDEFFVNIRYTRLITRQLNGEGYTHVGLLFLARYCYISIIYILCSLYTFATISIRTLTDIQHRSNIRTIAFIVSIKLHSQL